MTVDVANAMGPPALSGLTGIMRVVLLVSGTGGRCTICPRAAMRWLRSGGAAVTTDPALEFLDLSFRTNVL